MGKKRKRHESLEENEIKINISDFNQHLRCGEIPSNKKEGECYSLMYGDYTLQIKVEGCFKKVEGIPILSAKLVETAPTINEVELETAFTSQSKGEISFVVNLELNNSNRILETLKTGYQKKSFYLKFQYQNTVVVTNNFGILRKQQFDKIINPTSDEVFQHLELLRIDTPSLNSEGGDFMRLFFLSKFKKVSIKSSKFEIMVNGEYSKVFTLVHDYKAKHKHVQEGFLMFETPKLLNAEIQIFEVFYNKIRLAFIREQRFQFYEVLNVSEFKA